jgi:opacity protein-like surface antigen
MKMFLRVIGAGALFVAVSFAQDFSRVSYSIGGGFSDPWHNPGGPLAIGAMNVVGSVGWNYNQYLGINLDLGIDRFGPSALFNLGGGATNQNLHVLRATFDPIVHFNPKGKIDVYFTAGIGFLHASGQTTLPNGSTAPATSTVVPGPGTFSATKPGMDLGIGVSVPVLKAARLFAQAGYVSSLGGTPSISFLPVSFGLRW